MNKKNIKVTVFLVFLFVLLNITIYSVAQTNKQQRIQVALDSHLDKLEIQYNTLIYHWRVTANAAYKSTIGMKPLIDILSKAQTANDEEKIILRKQFFNILKNKYNALKTKGVFSYSFILPDKTAFVRMSDSQRFGDDVSSHYRVEYVTKFKKQIRGYETGKITPAFRNAYPIFSKPSITEKERNDNYLGMIVISFLTDNIRNYLKEVSKIDTHFLIHKDIFNKKFKRKEYFMKNYSQSYDHTDYLISTTDKDDYKKYKEIYNTKIKQIKKEIYHKINQGRKFSVFTINNGKATIISFYPIKDIKDKKTVAWIVSYENDNFIDMTLSNTSILMIISFFVLLILFYFAYRVINQKEILDIQVKEKTNDLSKTNRELEESEYELQLLNENLTEMVKVEVKKSQEKEQILFQQSKMASMGEMIGNIAHQWRQPIAIISMWANNIIADIDMDEIENENLRKYANNINEQTQHLSQTIDDFRNFFIPNKEKTTFTLKSSIDKTMSLLTASFKSHNIEVIKNIEDITITALENELTQAILNIVKNAKDALVTLPTITRRLIFINIYKKDNNVYIEIKDSGAGIPENIIDKIFEPYFTTKHKSQGTGIGLYMTESIITKHLDGEISVENVEFEYENNQYIGAKFSIKIPNKKR